MCKHHFDRHPSPPIWFLPLLALTMLGVIAALTGCSRQPNQVKVHNAYIKYEGTPRAYAYEFRLMDGTRCVAYNTAITCEWKQPVILVPRVE